jgi:hypothetical protein
MPTAQHPHSPIVTRRVLEVEECDFTRCPNFIRHEMSEEQIILIAKKAVELARDDFYKGVGKSVTNKFFILVGGIAVSLTYWLHSTGYLKY